MPKHCFSFRMSSKCESLSVPLKIRNLSMYCILTKYFSMVLIWGIIQAKLVLDELISMESHAQSVALSIPISLGSNWYFIGPVCRTNPWLSLKPPTVSKHGHYGPVASFSPLTVPSTHTPSCPNWWDTFRWHTYTNWLSPNLSVMRLPLNEIHKPLISVLWGYRAWVKPPNWALAEGAAEETLWMQGREREKSPYRCW